MSKLINCDEKANINITQKKQANSRKKRLLLATDGNRGINGNSKPAKTVIIVVPGIEGTSTKVVIGKKASKN
ncbi:hypothetical protein ACRQ5D_31805 [Mucilaginibacter sp. P25]|uniref:hypothetical protein n=1 Tax=unclassified Mucilaginibacter TaxID=2617802 RepID=UPI003D67C3FF